MRKPVRKGLKVFQAARVIIQKLDKIEAGLKKEIHRDKCMSTIFSKIISGEASADIVYKDERVTAFHDINPAAPTHILIVPNKFIPTVNDLEEEDAALVGHMVMVAKKLAAEEGISDGGYRLIINCNQDGGQVVFHLHLHLIGGRPLGPMVRRPKLE